MKREIVILFCILLVALFSQICIPTNAESNFTINEEIDNLVYNNVNLSEVENFNGTIESIAVSDSGSIAVGFSNKMINVYNSNANFCYSFIFNRTHYSYFLEWEGDALHIYARCIDWQYDIQIQDGNVYVYNIDDSEANEKNGENLTVVQVEIMKKQNLTNMITTEHGFNAGDTTKKVMKAI